MKRILTRTLLSTSGLLIGLIGGAILISPIPFMEMSDITLEQNPDLISELTAPSGVLLITSAIMLLGAIKLRFADLALLSGVIVYGSYGISRLFSLLLHGMPGKSLVTAMIVEIGLAILLMAAKLFSPAPS